MKTLDRKLLRDLRAMWSQVLTIALVVASGIAGFVTSFSAFDSLTWSRDVYYRQARFADVFATLKRAPLALGQDLQSLPGVAQVDTLLTEIVPISLADVPDPIVGRLVGLDLGAQQRLNLVQLRRGRMPNTQRTGALETLVSEGFAQARKLTPGDRVGALINGRQEALLIVGIGLSPEYIFAGLGGSPDQRGFGVFWVDRQALGAAYHMEGAFNQLALRLAPGSREDAVIDQVNRLLAPYGGMDAHGRDRQISHLILSSEIREQRVLGTVLPTIFLAVAGFLLNVVLSRQIATQREQIAALKALGYEDRAIGVHYLKLVLLIVGLGLALGLALGAGLGRWMMELYAGVFRFPELHYRVQPWLVAVAASVALGAAGLGTLQAIGATVRLAPAQAMRAPAPGLYRPVILERLGLTSWFSPASRMVLRTMERRPLRTLLTILGIAVAMAIVISGAFWRDTIDRLIDTQFARVQRGDVTLILLSPQPAAVAQEIARLPQVTAVEALRSASVRLTNANHEWHGALQGKPPQPELHRIIGENARAVEAPKQGLLLTDRLADKLQVRPGDLITVEFLEGERTQHQLPLVGTVREFMGMNAYLDIGALHRLLHEDARVNQLSVAVQRGYEAEFLQHLKQIPRVTAALSKAVMLRNIQDVTARNMLVFSAILTGFASMIAIGVVYNHARIALAERAWELASLRVLGFTRAEVSSLLLGELALEITFATPLGMGLGYLLAAAIVNLIKSDEFYFPLTILPATYALAALCILASAGISALVVRRRVDTLDLVGVLKTRE